MKPTLYYALVSGLLWFGLATDRPLLQRVLGSTYPGPRRDRLAQAHPQLGALLRLHGRAQRSRVAQQHRPIFWVGFKLWGALPLTFLFAAANIPMLLRHGLMNDDAVPAEPGPVE